VKRILLDTNVYIDWLNHGRYEHVVLGQGFLRHLSSVVVMELRAGAATRAAERALDQLIRAYDKGGRLVTPHAATFDQAGRLLRKLRAEGREVRRASFVNDLLIALSARDIGAAVITRDASDFAVIAQHVPIDVGNAVDDA
jgi:predicted nucleic acid-binding protein